MSNYGAGHPPPPGPPPGAMGQAPGGMTPPPPNHLVWAILTTIFCCLPLGVASIVFAAQVNSKWQIGDVAGAQESSTKAKQFAIWAVVAGVVVYAAYAIYMFVIVGSVMSQF